MNVIGDSTNVIVDYVDKIYDFSCSELYDCLFSFLNANQVRNRQFVCSHSGIGNEVIVQHFANFLKHCIYKNQEAEGMSLQSKNGTFCLSFFQEGNWYLLSGKKPFSECRVLYHILNILHYVKPECFSPADKLKLLNELRNKECELQASFGKRKQEVWKAQQRLKVTLKNI